MARAPGLIIESPRRADGRLSLVRVEPGYVVTSCGEQLRVRYEKLLHLAEQVCQEGAAVALRTWQGKDEPELVELYRENPPAPPGTDAEQVVKSETF